MSPIWGHAIGVIIVLMMLVFGAIWLWAWLPHHKNAFAALARLPVGDGGTPDQPGADERR